MIAPSQLDHAAYAARCRRLSAAELLFTIEDCRQSLAAWPDSPNAGRYTDEIHYCSAEILRRERGGKRRPPSRYQLEEQRNHDSMIAAAMANHGPAFADGPWPELD
jgi:hypothetical protein